MGQPRTHSTAMYCCAVERGAPPATTPRASSSPPQFRAVQHVLHVAVKGSAICTTHGSEGQYGLPCTWVLQGCLKVVVREAGPGSGFRLSAEYLPLGGGNVFYYGLWTDRLGSLPLPAPSMALTTNGHMYITYYWTCCTGSSSSNGCSAGPAVAAVAATLCPAEPKVLCYSCCSCVCLGVRGLV